MKADWGWVWAGDVPPGPYSTSTPFMLLPGTLGRAWSKTIATLALWVACAEAGLRASIAATAQRIGRRIRCLLIGSRILNRSFDCSASVVRGLAIEPILVGGRTDLRVVAGGEGFVVQL